MLFTAGTPYQSFHVVVGKKIVLHAFLGFSKFENWKQANLLVQHDTGWTTSQEKKPLHCFLNIN